MAGIIETVQKKQNPFKPMEPMQGPNGLTAPEDTQTVDLAKPRPTPGAPTTGGQFTSAAPTPFPPQTPAPESPNMATAPTPAAPGQPYVPPEAPNLAGPAPTPAGPILPPEDVQPDQQQPVSGVPVPKSQPFIPRAADAGIIDSAMTTGVWRGGVDSAMTQPMKAEGSSGDAQVAQAGAAPNSIEAQMAEDAARQAALTGAGPAATQSSGGSQTGGVLTATGGLLNDGGSGTDFTETATEATAGTTNGNTAWSPTAGIVDQIRGVTPQTIDGSKYDPTAIDPTQNADTTGYKPTGYDATKAPDAVGADVGGYEAGGYDAAQTDENLSGAVDRITSKDGIIMQRAKALADQQSLQRGTLNSSMATGAAQAAVLDKATEIGAGDVAASQFNVQQKNNALAFSADARNKAAEFLASAKNNAAMALAAEKNQNGRFNAQQANEAAAFTANAANAADAFLASAKNNVSIFNAGEANKRALASAEFANQAKQFAAQMDQASKEFNATAYNQAQQRYTDAMNAALAAQNDAENLARRDTAQINADLLKTKMGLGTQQQIASSNNATTMGVAGLNAQTRQRELDQSALQFGLQLSQQDRQFVSQLSATQFNQFQQGLNAGMLTEMEPEARQNWLHNYMSVWSATGTLPFDIDLSHFPPAGAPSSGTPSGNPPNPNPVGR
jgi:hypothetical protein